MASSISIVTAITHKDTNGRTVLSVPQRTDTYTPASDICAHIPKAVTTSEVTIDLSTTYGITSCRKVSIRNNDATNYVTVGSSTGSYSVRVNAGREESFKPNGAILYMAANSATCQCEIKAFPE